MKIIPSIVVALAVVTTAGAQSADKLYKAGKELYDAKNYSAAFPKLQEAAAKGHKKAQYRLGRCYDKGHGVAENDSLAFVWYLKSAEQEYAKAQYQVGKSYKNGEGVAKDRQKAVAYFTLAAKQGNADAQYQLAKAYLNGKGVKADKKQAAKWLTKAVRNEKGGDEVMRKMREDAAAGDETAAEMLRLVGK